MDKPAEPHDEIATLRRLLQEQDRLLDSYRASLSLQGMRGDGLQADLDGRRHRIHQIETSIAWRLTTPLRYGRALAAGRLPNGQNVSDAARRVIEIAKEEGSAGLAKRVRHRLGLRKRGRRPSPSLKPQPAPSPRTDARQPPSDAVPTAAPQAPVIAADPYAAALPVGLDLQPTILIVAELSIPQCAKYRVWQKQELLRSLGWQCEVLDWHQFDRVTTALQLCREVIFYRVPASEPVFALFAEARRLGLSPLWEVDDLIFDEPLYKQNSNLKTLEPSLREEVLSGIRRYRQAMLACSRAIASTSRLADCMREAGIPDVSVVENALDSETLRLAAELHARREARPLPNGQESVTIVYGSGTKTHDADFACAADGLLAVMRRHSQVRLRIVGELTLADAFEAFGDRVERLPGTSYATYLGLLAEADIAIAPLEATIFNDAKSNIKFQEAAILGIPSVVSPRQAFREVVVAQSGPLQNGLLADTPAEWEAALARLVGDAGLRTALGEQARAAVLERYAPDQVARTQLLPLFGHPEAPKRKALRVLAANVFFAPQSFGGATVVAEALARRIAARDDAEIFVFTTRPAREKRPFSLLRYEVDGIPVFAIPMHSASDQVVQLDSPTMATVFGQLLDAVRPDIVHAHSIQSLSASILRVCQERGIPYVITLHDAWWLCERQFMVRGDKRYCFQTSIDLRVCQNCLPGAHHLDERMRITKNLLHGAALLLSPSESHRQLYLANGLDPSRVRVNRNGVRFPLRARSARPPGAPLRFGYVGGNESIKGFHLLRKAFEALPRDDWHLVLVDNTLKLGFSSIDTDAWKVRGKIEIVAPYDQDEVDAFFDRIDVLLFPSQWKESYGLTVREAMVRDVWVIATGQGGQAEEIEDGVNGRLIPLDGRHEKLAAAIGELLDDPSRLERYRNPHKDRMATLDGQAQELLAHFRNVVEASADDPLRDAAATASLPAGRC